VMIVLGPVTSMVGRSAPAVATDTIRANTRATALAHEASGEIGVRM
jgi:hypothetical protein